MGKRESGRGRRTESASSGPSSQGEVGQRGPAGADAPWLRPGHVLGERFRIVRWIGRGGMGEVHEAEDLELGIAVALKRLHRDLGTDDALQRLKREVLLARSVSHPSLCRLHDVFRFPVALASEGHAQAGGDATFLTMELLRGGTLQDALRRHGRMTTSAALPLVRQMTDGLSAIHRAGAVHRDFKSANVMLVAAGDRTRAVVTDFGLASAAFEEDSAATGTPAYMSPEQVRGRGVGPTADVHALGVVLFEMVTGRLPFRGGSAREILAAKSADEAPSPRLFVPDLPSAWEEVVLRCLRRDPSERFARVEDVVAALEGRAEAPPERASVRLPGETDSFVGRAEILAEMRRALDEDTRCLTLVGPPGCGKTRLALHFAWGRAASGAGAAWSCDVALSTREQGMAAIVASTLGVPVEAGDLGARVGLALASHGRALLVLDGVEHALAGATRLVGQWLEKAPELRVVITSRERLGAAFERSISLPPLPEDEARELFVQRAVAARPGFALDADVEPMVLDVLRVLEGQPLALELAAGRLQALAPGRLRERLEDLLGVLVSARDAGHHASLHGAIDASWQLLAPWEKALFAQCSVFLGGAPLEAVEEVADLSRWTGAPPALDVVRALADKSLLRIQHAQDGIRLSMLASLHAFARERLDEDEARVGEASGARSSAEARHGAWFARLGDHDAYLASTSSGRERRVDRRALDVANLDVACRRACARGDSAVAADACVAACSVYHREGPQQAGEELCDLTLALDSLSPLQRARVQLAAGAMQRGISAARAAAHFTEALAIARDLSDLRLEGSAVVAIGLTAFALGRTDELERHAARALEIATLTGDLTLLPDARRLLGDASQARGRIEESLAHHEAAMAACREEGNAVMEAMILTKSANVRYISGRDRSDAPRRDLERALAVLEKRRIWNTAAFARHALASIHEDAGRPVEARLHLDAALHLAEQAGSPTLVGRILQHLGGLDVQSGNLESARARYEQSLPLFAGLNAHFEAESRLELVELELAQGRSDDAVDVLHRILQIEHCAGSCVLKAEILRLLGRVHLDAGRVPQAAKALAEAEPMMLAQPYPRPVARFLCTRGECELASGEPDRARASLAAARVRAQAGGDHTSVRKAIEALELALRQSGFGPA